MTREDRWIVTLDEIIGVRWQCPRCKVSVSYVFAEKSAFPRRCPSCAFDVVPDEFTEHGKAVWALVRALQALRQPQPNGQQLTLSLEFAAPPERYR